MKKLLLILLIFLVPSVLAITQPTNCTTNSTCQNNWYCHYGQCTLDCSKGGHYDCPTGWYCYIGRCVLDPTNTVYHCDKAGCPPGETCITSVGKTQKCAENASYKCNTSCDCGPAHCCKNGVCIKDTADPFFKGGTAIVQPGCQHGVDATYCCESHHCHGADFAYGVSSTSFKCYSSNTNKVQNYCGGKKCYVDSDCMPGEACIDFANKVPRGNMCDITEGGGCVNSASAMLFYGVKSSDLVSSCKYCAFKGEKCIAGWKSGGIYAYEKVMGKCKSCGDGKCDPGEYPLTCKDCSCGDGVCSPTEVGSCNSDCGSCGDGKCQSHENPKICAVDCKAGSGNNWCDTGETGSDCICPGASSYSGVYTACGDGYCHTQTETITNCAIDCKKIPGNVSINTTKTNTTNTTNTTSGGVFKFFQGLFSNIADVLKNIYAVKQPDVVDPIPIEVIEEEQNIEEEPVVIEEEIPEVEEEPEPEFEQEPEPEEFIEEHEHWEECANPGEPCELGCCDGLTCCDELCSEECFEEEPIEEQFCAEFHEECWERDCCEGMDCCDGICSDVCDVEEEHWEECANPGEPCEFGCCDGLTCCDDLCSEFCEEPWFEEEIPEEEFIEEFVDEEEFIEEEEEPEPEQEEYGGFGIHDEVEEWS